MGFSPLCPHCDLYSSEHITRNTSSRVSFVELDKVEVEFPNCTVVNKCVYMSLCTHSDRVKRGVWHTFWNRILWNTNVGWHKLQISHQKVFTAARIAKRLRSLHVFIEVWELRLHQPFGTAICLLCFIEKGKWGENHPFLIQHSDFKGNLYVW